MASGNKYRHADGTVTDLSSVLPAGMTGTSANGSINYRGRCYSRPSPARPRCITTTYMTAVVVGSFWAISRST